MSYNDLIVLCILLAGGLVIVSILAFRVRADYRRKLAHLCCIHCGCTERKNTIPTRECEDGVIRPCGPIDSRCSRCNRPWWDPEEEERKLLDQKRLRESAKEKRQLAAKGVCYKCRHPLIGGVGGECPCWYEASDPREMMRLERIRYTTPASQLRDTCPGCGHLKTEPGLQVADAAEKHISTGECHVCGKLRDVKDLPRLPDADPVVDVSMMSSPDDICCGCGHDKREPGQSWGEKCVVCGRRYAPSDIAKAQAPWID